MHHATYSSALATQPHSQRQTHCNENEGNFIARGRPEAKWWGVHYERGEGKKEKSGILLRQQQRAASARSIVCSATYQDPFTQCNWCSLYCSSAQRTPAKRMQKTTLPSWSTWKGPGCCAEISSTTSTSPLTPLFRHCRVLQHRAQVPALLVNGCKLELK